MMADLGAEKEEPIAYVPYIALKTANSLVRAFEIPISTYRKDPDFINYETRGRFFGDYTYLCKNCHRTRSGHR